MKKKAPRARAAVSTRAFVSSARPTEALIFERRDGRDVSVVTALVDRRTGGLALLSQADGLAWVDADALRTLARGPVDAPPLAEVELGVARLRLARAVAATRIAGGEVPDWLAARADLVGDAFDPATRVNDIYLCIACDRALPVHEQLARAEQRGQMRAPPRCPHCRGDSQALDCEGEAWLGRAWLMITAGLPRRALVCAAHAEGLRLAADRLAAVRGAAYLALGDRNAASPYLRHALSREADHERASIMRGWLCA